MRKKINSVLLQQEVKVLLDRIAGDDIGDDFDGSEESPAKSPLDFVAFAPFNIINSRVDIS